MPVSALKIHELHEQEFEKALDVFTAAIDDYFQRNIGLPVSFILDFKDGEEGDGDAVALYVHGEVKLAAYTCSLMWSLKALEEFAERIARAYRLCPKSPKWKVEVDVEGSDIKLTFSIVTV